MILRNAVSAAFCTFAVVICGCDNTTQQPLSSPVSVVDDDFQAPSNGFLGLTFRSADESPLVVDSPVPGSGAEEAGVLKGDLLITVAGQQNPTLDEIYRVVIRTAPGDELPIVIRRDQQDLPMNVRLLSYDEVQKAMTATKQTD